MAHGSLKDLLRPIWIGGHFVALRWTGRLPSQQLRKWIYRLYGARLGRGCVIYGGCEMRHPRGVQVGEMTSVGHDCVLDGRMGLVLGDNVNLSSQVMIWTLQHDYRDPMFAAVGGPVSVGRHAWLSARSIILPGVRIGEGAVVAAGAVVTRDVPDFQVVGGIPAKFIAERPRDLRYSLGSCMWMA